MCMHCLTPGQSNRQSKEAISLELPKASTTSEGTSDAAASTSRTCVHVNTCKVAHGCHHAAKNLPKSGKLVKEHGHPATVQVLLMPQSDGTLRGIGICELDCSKSAAATVAANGDISTLNVANLRKHFLQLLPCVRPWNALDDNLQSTGLASPLRWPAACTAATRCTRRPRSLYTALRLLDVPVFAVLTNQERASSQVRAIHCVDRI
mmetsp:Transcript_23335/g.69318  ORF Transcript_23335/g.69318 Transcript_23335/m.69318 type:complete len:207 (-) Transcript_23335:440-1060(-)